MSVPSTSHPVGEPLLQVRGATLRFGGIVALNAVDLAVQKGTIHALIGPNGAGKSSMFNAICGLYPLNEGSVTFAGTTTTGRRPDQIAALGIGRAFQNASMLEDLTVEENLLVGRHRLLAGPAGPFRRGAAGESEEQARAAVRRVAELAELTPVLHEVARTLPYGTQKRVDVARALASDPQLLLLDEPAAGLHTSEKAQLADFLRAIGQDLGLTILLVEHDMPLVQSVSQAVTVLNFGELVVSGPPAEVLADPRVVAAYLGTSEMEEAS